MTIVQQEKIAGDWLYFDQAHRIASKRPRAGLGFAFAPWATWVSSAMRTRAERYVALTILKLGNGFAALYTTAVAIVASSKHNILIKVFLPLNAALIPTGAVTPPPPRDPILDSMGERRQCRTKECRNDRPNDGRNDRGNDQFATDCQL